MKTQQFIRLAFVAVAFGGAMGTAQSAHYVELQGADINFFVDADYYDLSQATVTGNTISFALDPERYGASATGTRVSSANQYSFSSDAGKALYVVAHDGFNLLATVNTAANSAYQLTGNGGGANGYVSTHAFLATYADGVFSSEPFQTNASGAQINKLGAGSGAQALTLSPPYSTTILADAMAVSSSFSLMVYQKGISTSSISLNEVSYSFTSVAEGATLPPVQPPITPSVPEPETYAMLVAGLGLIALLRRRT